MVAFEELVASLAREGAAFMTMEDAAREAEPRIVPLAQRAADLRTTSEICNGCLARHSPRV